jgi:hypothetical protein
VPVANEEGMKKHCRSILLLWLLLLVPLLLLLLLLQVLLTPMACAENSENSHRLALQHNVHITWHRTNNCDAH